MSFTFLHAADLHIDSPLLGLEQYHGAPVDQVRTATRRAFENLVALAVQERVAFLLLAGDIFDDDWKDFHTGLWFVRALNPLAEAKIPVFMISGNHDAESHITKSLRLPPNVFRFPSRRADTHRLDEWDVAVHGQSYKTRAIFDDLSAAYPGASSGCFNIGLLHTCATGSEGHEAYAPCTVEGLRGKGYDYWALGHIHQRRVLCEDPWILFSGNLQGRHIRETGPKGATLVTVARGVVAKVEPRDLDVMRWNFLELDMSGIPYEGIFDLAEQKFSEAAQAAEGKPVALRVRLFGRTGAHSKILREREYFRNELRLRAIDATEGTAWLEKILIETKTAEKVAPSPDGQDPIGGLMKAIDALQAAPEQRAAWIEETASALSSKLSVLGPLRDVPDWKDDAAGQMWLEEVRQLLLARLQEEET